MRGGLACLGVVVLGLGALRATAAEPCVEGHDPGGWCWKSPGAPSDDLKDAWAVDAHTVLAVGPPERVMHWRDGAWRYLPSGTSSTLNAVWAASPQDAWAVGEAGTIVHWDGLAWTQVRTGGSMLFAVFGTSPRDVWAGGEDGLLLHWDGLRWNDMPGVTSQMIRSLWASGPQDVWLSAADAEDTEGEVLRWNGLRWSSIPSPGEKVYGLWGFGPQDVWAVGNHGLLANWRGGSWQRAPTFDEHSALFKLRGLDSRRLWVVGGSLMRFDGDRLRLEPYDHLSATRLSAVAIGEGGPLLAVGGDGALVRSLDSGRWEVQVPEITSGTGDFASVWANSPEQAWAVRTDGQLYRWEGELWRRDTSTPLMSMASVSGSSASDVWLAGRMNKTYEAVLVHFDGTEWREFLFPKSEHLRDVWALNARDAWAVGDGGLVRRWNGYSWGEALTLRGQLTCVHGSSADNVWVAGSSGVLFQWDGRRWVDRSINDPGLQDIWVFGPNDVWIVGARRTLWHWDGQQVQRVAGITAPLNALYGRAPDDLWAVGGAGSVLHWDGAAWSTMPTGTRRELKGVWGSKARLFAVGAGATILQRD